MSSTNKEGLASEALNPPLQLGTCDSQKPQSCATDFYAFAICYYVIFHYLTTGLYLTWKCQTRFNLVLMKKKNPLLRS